MRKIALLVAVTAALLALGVSTVFAQQTQRDGSGKAVNAEYQPMSHNNQVIQCRTIPCMATGNHNMVYERIGNRKNDRIILKGGDDQVRADLYGKDKDVIKGNLGSDLIRVNDGDRRDRIFGGKGNDKCYVDARSEVVGGCTRIIRVRPQVIDG
jgi:hypothetical protein